MNPGAPVSKKLIILGTRFVASVAFIEQIYTLDRRAQLSCYIGLARPDDLREQHNFPGPALSDIECS